MCKYDVSDLLDIVPNRFLNEEIRPSGVDYEEEKVPQLENIIDVLLRSTVVRLLRPEEYTQYHSTNLLPYISTQELDIPTCSESDIEDASPTLLNIFRKLKTDDAKSVNSEDDIPDLVDEQYNAVDD